MNYPADSTAKLCQGGKGRYVVREGVPVAVASYLIVVRQRKQ